MTHNASAQVGRMNPNALPWQQNHASSAGPPLRGAPPPAKSSLDPNSAAFLPRDPLVATQQPPFPPGRGAPSHHSIQFMGGTHASPSHSGAPHGNNTFFPPSRGGGGYPSHHYSPNAGRGGMRAPLTTSGVVPGEPGNSWRHIASMGARRSSPSHVQIPLSLPQPHQYHLHHHHHPIAGSSSASTHVTSRPVADHDEILFSAISRDIWNPRDDNQEREPTEARVVPSAIISKCAEGPSASNDNPHPSQEPNSRGNSLDRLLANLSAVTASERQDADSGTQSSWKTASWDYTSSKAPQTVQSDQPVAASGTVQHLLAQLTQEQSDSPTAQKSGGGSPTASPPWPTEESSHSRTGTQKEEVDGSPSKLVPPPQKALSRSTKEQAALSATKPLAGGPPAIGSSPTSGKQSPTTEKATLFPTSPPSSTSHHEEEERQLVVHSLRPTSYVLAGEAEWLRPPRVHCRNRSEVESFLQQHNAKETLRHVKILSFSRQHPQEVVQLFQGWAAKGIPAPDDVFGAYYYYVAKKSGVELCMKHNGRGKTAGSGYGGCDFANRGPNFKCRFHHVCLFCKGEDHGWFDEGKCQRYQHFLQEVERMKLNDGDVTELVSAYDRV